MDANDRQLSANLLLALRWVAVQAAKYLVVFTGAAAVASIAAGGAISDVAWAPVGAIWGLTYGWFGLLPGAYLLALWFARQASPRAFRALAVLGAPACNLLAVIAPLNPRSPLVAVLLAHLMFGAWVSRPPPFPGGPGAGAATFRDGVYRPFG